MRTLSVICLAVTALALTVVYAQYPSAWNLLLIVVLLATLGALAWVAEGHLTTYALMAVAAATSYAAGFAAGTRELLLDSGQATMLGLLAMAGGIAALGWVRRRLRRVYPHELVVLTGRFTPSFEPVAGPAYVLPLLSKELAVMPRYQQEHELTIERVNTRARDGALGPVAQNIDRLVVELVYKLDDAACFKAFAIHNRDAIFNESMQRLNKGFFAALRDKEFWVGTWSHAIDDIAERLVRAAVHRSGMTAVEVSERRDEIAELVIERLREEAAQIGLVLQEFNVLQVEPDESAADLAGREALLQALARVEEIKLTGEAYAQARAAQVRAMVAAVRDGGGQVPQRIVELIVRGVLPATVLGAYLPNGAAGLHDPLLDAHERPGPRPGDPRQN